MGSADAVRTVIAVEVDAGLVRWLERLCGGTTCAWSTPARWRWTFTPCSRSIPGPGGTGKVIANLPYYITTPLLMRFLEEGPPLDSRVVMVQREVAQRLTARPGTKDYGALSVAVQLRADVETVGVVSPHVFFPKPAVESAVVRLKLRPLPGDVLDEAVLFAVVRAAFGQRRKTLRNALRAAAKASGGPASEAAPSPRRRGRGEGPGETGAPWPDRAVEGALAAAGIDAPGGARRCRRPSSCGWPSAPSRGPDKTRPGAILPPGPRAGQGPPAHDAARQIRSCARFLARPRPDASSGC